MTAHLSSAIGLLKAAAHKPQLDEQHEVLQVRKRPAPNSNSEKLIGFRSTKKKKVSLTRWAKPTIEEEETTKENMSTQNPIEVCAVCLKQDDRNQDDDNIVDWIECQICKLWVHAACAGGEICLFCKLQQAELRTFTSG